MKTILNRFVIAYKAILHMKQVYHFNDFIAKPIKNTSISVVILTAILLSGGYVFRLFENIHFVFISLNTIIVCSFVIYQATKELQFKFHHQVNYRTSYAVLLNLIYIFSILFTVNAGLLLLLFVNLVSVLFLILMLTLGLLMNVIYLILSSSVGLEVKSTNVLIISIWIFLLYLVLFYAIDIKHISIALSLNTFIVGIIVFMEHQLKKLYHMNLETVIALLFTMLVILVIYMGRINPSYHPQSVFIENQLNEKHIMLHSDHDFEIHKDTLYAQEGNVLYLYSLNLKPLSAIDPGFDHVVQYYFDFDDHLKVIIYSNDQSGLDDTNNAFRYEQYDISNIENPILEHTFVSSSLLGKTFINIEDELIMIEEMSSNEIYNAECLDQVQLGENRILYQDDYKLVFVKDGFLNYFTSSALNSNIHNYASYSNGKIIIDGDNDDTVTIIDIEDYLLDRDDSKITLDDMILRYIENFHFDGKKYYLFTDTSTNYFSYKLTYFHVYDDIGKSIHHVETDYHVFFNETGIYTYQLDSNGIDLNTVTVDSNRMITYQMITIHSTFNQTAFLMMLWLLVLIPAVIILKMRGDDNV